MKSRERTRDAAAQTSRDTVSLCRDESQEMRNFPPNRTRPPSHSRIDNAHKWKYNWMAVRQRKRQFKLVLLGDIQKLRIFSCTTTKQKFFIPNTVCRMFCAGCCV